MWNLDDKTDFVRVLDLRLPWAETWGDKYPERRERIRAVAAQVQFSVPPNAQWWAFRIHARKTKRRSFDIENVPKQIVDAFCVGRLRQDDSQYQHLGLYPDDSIDHVRYVQVSGERCDVADETRVEVFAFVGSLRPDVVPE